MQAHPNNIDAIKLQFLVADELLTHSHPKFSLFERLEIDAKGWNTIFRTLETTGVPIFADVYGKRAYELSTNFPIDAYKIPPSETANLELIELVARSGKSVMIGAGGITQSELRSTFNECKALGCSDLAIIHGYQEYPTPIENSKLGEIICLKNEFSCPVGYADHVWGEGLHSEVIPIIAAMMGADIIEKHFTLNRSAKGIDYESSVEQESLDRIVQLLRLLPKIIESTGKGFSTGEATYRADVRKRIVASVNLSLGQVISKDIVAMKRSDDGLFADDLKKILGTQVNKDIAKGDPITENDLVKHMSEF